MAEEEERWRQLWDEASVETDPKKRLGTTHEINRLLGEGEKEQEKAIVPKEVAGTGDSGSATCN